MTSNVQYIVYSYLVVTYSLLTYFWLFFASYVAFGAHNLGKKEREKEKDRFSYVGIVDQKSKMELEIPARGSGGSSPPPFFLFWRETQNSKSEKRKEK